MFWKEAEVPPVKLWLEEIVRLSHLKIIRFPLTETLSIGFGIPPISITLIAQSDELDNTDALLWCDKIFGMMR